MKDPEAERRRRKEEGRLKKRQRIEESGGIRPRKDKSKTEENEKATEKAVENRPSEKIEKNYQSDARRRNSPMNRQSRSSGHRFGRVMENVPCRNKPRFSTLSIALPGSVLCNCQTKELRTLLVGQIARAASIYHVDEIVVFDDKLGKSGGGFNRYKSHSPRSEPVDSSSGNQSEKRYERSDPQTFMARVLQYCECPQYLRRHFFPMHPDLQFSGLLAPLDAPHHVRVDDRSRYREGVILDKKPTREDVGSLVNCGIRSRPVAIDRKLAPGIRCTVKLDPKDYGKTGPLRGTVVSPAAPREDDGTYWGYTTRLASSINDVFDSCPYEEGYDLKIGTSERGDRSIEEKSFKLPKFEHALIVFGGVAGIEECVDADESIKLPGSQSRQLFDIWLNTCPYQGSRTIRTEEAVLISLTALNSAIAKSSRDEAIEVEEPPIAEFSDESPSDESSESGHESS